MAEETTYPLNQDGPDIQRAIDAALAIDEKLEREVERATQAESGKQDTLVSGTNIKTVNNQSLLGSGNIEIQGGGGSTTVIDNLNSTSTTAALSANQGRVLKGMVDNKQETLVSGTNIKTINGTSILGSGNINIDGGGDTMEPITEDEINEICV